MGEAHGRAGMVRLHWVTEWQRRGVPHLHCAIWFPDAYDTITPTRAWVEVASAYGAGLRGQHARIIDGPVGWFQYLAKHAARGVKHYQRTADSIPEGWQKRPGACGEKSATGRCRKRSVLTFRISTATVGGSPTGVSSAAGGWPMPGQQGMRTASGQRGAMLQCPDQVRARLIGYSSGCPTRSDGSHRQRRGSGIRSHQLTG